MLGFCHALASSGLCAYFRLPRPRVHCRYMLPQSRRHLLATFLDICLIETSGNYVLRLDLPVELGSRWTSSWRPLRHEAAELARVCHEWFVSPSAIVDLFAVRRVRCDRTLPSCTRCVKSGNPCNGYGMRLSWPRSNDQRRAVVAPPPRGRAVGVKPGEIPFLHTTSWDVNLHHRLTAEGWNSKALGNDARLRHN